MEGLSNRLLKPRHLQFVWKKPTPRSLLKKLILTLFVCYLSYARFASHISKYSPEMLSELALMQCGQMRAIEGGDNMPEVGKSWTSRTTLSRISKSGENKEVVWGGLKAPNDE